MKNSKELQFKKHIEAMQFVINDLVKENHRLKTLLEEASSENIRSRHRHTNKV